MSEPESLGLVQHVPRQVQHGCLAVSEAGVLAGRSISCVELRYLIATRAVPVVELAGEQLVAINDIAAYLARHALDVAAGVQSEVN